MDMTEKVLGKGTFTVDSMDAAFFKGKYDLTTTEAAAMLDLSERYLCDDGAWQDAAQRPVLN